MSRESKIIDVETSSLAYLSSTRLSGTKYQQDIIQAYESFGWELLGINGDQISMSRETQNPVYAELVQYQAQYEAKIAEIKALGFVDEPEEPDEFDLETFGICLICLIVPALVYAGIKIGQRCAYKKKMEEYELAVAELEKKKNIIREEMKKIALDSRATFFSKQN